VIIRKTIRLADQRATAEQAEALRRDLGLDRPLAERFFIFLGNAVQGGIFPGRTDGGLINIYCQNATGAQFDRRNG
jgi:ABC-type dipeptide/oligopeptide/nickel transport system permease component